MENDGGWEGGARPERTAEGMQNDNSGAQERRESERMREGKRGERWGGKGERGGGRQILGLEILRARGKAPHEMAVRPLDGAREGRHVFAMRRSGASLGEHVPCGDGQTADREGEGVDEALETGVERAYGRVHHGLRIYEQVRGDGERDVDGRVAPAGAGVS